MWATVNFALTTLLITLIAHACGYLTHEYAHSLAAWSLGWMTHPFGIDYGHLTVYNAIFLDDVGDNVAYGPIFAGGHGLSAAFIALAGPFIGNGLLYFCSYFLAQTRVVRSHGVPLALVYWFSLMCAGNVWGYVPIRAITTHADIALAAQGLGISTWTLFPFLLVIALYIVYHFFCRMFPAVYTAISGRSKTNFLLIATLTGFWFFSFFGADGIAGNYGLISQILSIASRYMLFPLCVVYLCATYLERVDEITSVDVKRGANQAH